ncbi:MazG-like nucleotide pyrophosphohydrolase [Microbacterium phage SadLad]|nr:MazG-like nucleotide pyrophosphohydrolase [Microbacterium phage SadLad]
MTDLKPQMREITDEVERTTEPDSADRATTRARIVLDMFYDGVTAAPETAIADCIADLMHLAAEHELDFETIIQAASRTWSDELEEWGDRDAQ